MIMFFQVHIQRSFRPKTSHARSIKTDEFFYSSMNNQKVVDHLLVKSAVDLAKGAGRFSSIHLQMIQQMQPEDICGIRSIVEALEADAACFFFRSGRRMLLDFDEALF